MDAPNRRAETLLEALPESATAEVHLEVTDADDEIEVSESAPAKTTVTWHHRRTPDAFGAELAEAARAAAYADGLLRINPNLLSLAAAPPEGR